MASKVGESLLTRILELNDSNFDSSLPQIIVDLSRLPRTNDEFASCLKYLLSDVFIKFEIAEIEERFFKFFLPALQKIFSQNLLTLTSSIQNFQGDVKVELTQYWQVAFAILDRYNNLFVQLSCQGRVPCSSVSSLLQTFPCVLLEALSHCRDSSEIYAEFFTACVDELSQLFRQSHVTLSIFWKLLDEVIAFDCSSEKELVLLVFTVEKLGDIGAALLTLDSKALITHWKEYAKMTQKYVPHLKSRLDICHPIMFSITTLEQTVTLVKSGPDIDDKVKSRSVKMGSFFLKLIIKLCEEYHGYLGDCHRKLLDLLISLSSLEVEQYTTSSSIWMEVKQYILVGAGPLLRQLMGEREFIEEFTKLVPQMDSLTACGKQGLFILSLNLSKKLISLEPGIRRKWLDLGFLEQLLNMFCIYDQEIDCHGNIEDLYSSFVSRVAAVLVSSATTAQFHKLESLLIEKLFQTRLYPALLAQDLLALLARLMSGDVVVKQILYLSELLAQWPSSEAWRPELYFVGSTVARLFSLLPAKTKLALQTKYSAVEAPLLWKFLAPVATSETSLSLTPCFETFKATKSPKSYTILINALTLLPLELSLKRNCAAELSTMLSTFMELWRISSSLPSNSELSHMDILFLHVLRAIPHLLPMLTSSSLTQLLHDMKNIKASSGYEITTIFTCSDIRRKYFSAPSERLIRDIFTQALLSKDVLVVQLALSSAFSLRQMKSLNRCELTSEVIEKLIDKMPQPQKPTESETLSSLYDTLKEDFIHKCLIRDGLGVPGKCEASIQLGRNILRDLKTLNASNDKVNDELRLIICDIMSESNILRLKLSSM